MCMLAYMHAVRVCAPVSSTHCNHLYCRIITNFRRLFPDHYTWSASTGHVIRWSRSRGTLVSVTWSASTGHVVR